MASRTQKLFLVPLGAGLLIISLILLFPAAPVDAQCGSQASSCKNCHETQAQDPVNADGTDWHQAHAFGDFCYICHAGNQQATDKEAAHAGMVPPLSDVKASCQQCHPNDLGARAAGYAAVLGVEIGAGAGAGTGAPPTGDTPAAPAGETVAPAADTGAAHDTSVALDPQIALDDPNLVDYAARYDEIVLGKKPTNWGNLILLGMIGLVLVGGGGFVLNREKLVKVSFAETRPVGEEYPAEVVEMLPALVKLRAASRKSLKHLLANPQKADKVFGLLDAVISDETDQEAGK